MQDDLKTVLCSSKSFMQGDIMMKGNTDSQNKATGKRLAKVTPANSQRMVVVESLGFDRYALQDFGKPKGAVVQCSINLMWKARQPSEADCAAAGHQAWQMLQGTIAYVVEAITGERGVIMHGMK